MTAFRYTVCAVSCDHPGCPEASEAFEGLSAAAVREAAQACGWTRVRDGSRLRDLCPEHSA